MTSKLTYVALLTVMLFTVAGCYDDNGSSHRNVVNESGNNPTDNGTPDSNSDTSNSNSDSTPNSSTSDNSTPDSSNEDSNSEPNPEPEDGAQTLTSFSTFVVDLIQNQTADETESVEINELEFQAGDVESNNSEAEDNQKDNQEENEDDDAFKSLLL